MPRLEQTANDLLAKIRAGEISFEDAARENSTCPSGKEGGALGDFGRGQMVPEFDQACFEMEIGEVRGPVKTQFGYHIIRLNAKNAAKTIPFEEVKEEIRRRLVAEKQEAAYRSKINQLSILFPVDRY
jgi:peptidyl-prolyl cis-trans isomerase C